MTATAPRTQTDLFYQPWDVAPYAQLAYHTCPADERMYGGAAGGGKSEATLWDAIKKCQKYPGSRQVIFRRTMAELQDLIDRATHYIPKHIAVYNHNDERFVFQNESRQTQASILRFSHMNEEDDKLKHRGEQYTNAYFDEGSLFTATQMRYIRATRVRPPAGLPYPTTANFSSNPGGPGHLELRDRYVEPPFSDAELLARWNPASKRWERFPPGHTGRPEPFVVWRPPEDPDLEELNKERVSRGAVPIQARTRCFIPAMLEDNPALYNDPSYEGSLWELSNNDPELYKAMRRGLWSVFVGQMFTEWDPKLHVIPSFLIPNSWRRWRALDWGWGAPLCCLWLTNDPDTRRTYVYRELYRERLNDTEAIALINAMTPQYEHIDFTVADPSMWSQDSRDGGHSTATIYAQKGLWLIEANNARVQGVGRVHDALAIRRDTDSPGLGIFNSCPDLIRTLPALPRAKNRPEDVDTKAEDHAYDALRYGLMASPSLGYNTNNDPPSARPARTGRDTGADPYTRKRVPA